MPLDSRTSRVIWVCASILSVQAGLKRQGSDLFMRFVYWGRTELATFSSQHPIISKFKSNFPLLLCLRLLRDPICHHPPSLLAITLFRRPEPRAQPLRSQQLFRQEVSFCCRALAIFSYFYSASAESWIVLARGITVACPAIISSTTISDPEDYK